MNSFNPAAECYVLLLHQTTKTTVKVGSLGKVQLNQGWIYYVGRARRGWPSRLKRLTDPEDNLNKHWHIDYLVAETDSLLSGLIPVDWPAHKECQLAQAVEQSEKIRPLKKKFGATDCEAGCVSHGWQTRQGPEFLYRRLAGQNVPLAGGLLDFKEDRCDWRKLSAHSSR